MLTWGGPARSDDLVCLHPPINKAMCISQFPSHKRTCRRATFGAFRESFGNHVALPEFALNQALSYCAKSQALDASKMRMRCQQNLSLTFRNERTKILRALNSGVYYVGNAMRRPNVSSPEWECLFKPNFVLEQFKAMETALTVDIFLDVFHKILNATCHRPPTRHDKGGVFDEMQLLDWIQ